MGEEYESTASDIEIEEMDSDEETVASEMADQEMILPVAESVQAQPKNPPKSEDKPQIDVQTQIQIAMLQQKMHRQRMALKKNNNPIQQEKTKEQELSHRQNPTMPPNCGITVKSSSGRRQSRKTEQQDPSRNLRHLRWILFLAAAAESQQPQPPQRAKAKTSRRPNASQTCSEVKERLSLMLRSH